MKNMALLAMMATLAWRPVPRLRLNPAPILKGLQIYGGDELLHEPGYLRGHQRGDGRQRN